MEKRQLNLNVHQLSSPNVGVGSLHSESDLDNLGFCCALADSSFTSRGEFSSLLIFNFANNVASVILGSRQVLHPEISE